MYLAHSKAVTRGSALGACAPPISKLKMLNPLSFWGLCPLDPLQYGPSRTRGGPKVASRPKESAKISHLPLALPPGPPTWTSWGPD